MNIFSIDAWNHGEDDWQWNSWYKCGEINQEDFETLKSDADFIQYFIDGGYIDKSYAMISSFDLFTIDDDQYNIVIQDKETGEPLFAIEYGCEY